MNPTRALVSTLTTERYKPLLCALQLLRLVERIGNLHLAPLSTKPNPRLSRRTTTVRISCSLQHMYQSSCMTKCFARYSIKQFIPLTVRRQPLISRLKSKPPHLLLSAVACYWSMGPISCPRSTDSKPAAHRCCCRSMDGRSTSFTDSAPHTMRAVWKITSTKFLEHATIVDK